MTGKTLREMAGEVYENNVAKGWAGPDAPVRTFGEVIALLHSEISEALEAYRGLDDYGSHYEHSCMVWSGDVLRDRKPTGCDCIPKPIGVDSEFADVLIRMLDDCQRFGIDLDRAYEEKMAFNRTRPFRHGGKPL
jgi:hypothetical protein